MIYSILSRRNGNMYHSPWLSATYMPCQSAGSVVASAMGSLSQNLEMGSAWLPEVGPKACTAGIRRQDFLTPKQQFKRAMPLNETK